MGQKNATTTILIDLPGVNGNCRRLALWAYGSGRIKTPPGIFDVTVLHDDWCAYVKRGEDCTCEPHIRSGMDLVRWEDMPKGGAA